MLADRSEGSRWVVLLARVGGVEMLQMRKFAFHCLLDMILTYTFHTFSPNMKSEAKENMFVLGVLPRGSKGSQMGHRRVFFHP